MSEQPSPSARPSSPELDPAVAARLKRDADGLVAAIIQQHDTREVLMLGWMDEEAVHRTLTTGRVTFWSRSRRLSAAVQLYINLTSCMCWTTLSYT